MSNQSMDINKIDINDETVELQLSELIKKDKESNNIINASLKTNVWIPNSYDNQIEEAFGTTKIENSGILEFSFEQTKSSFNLFTNQIVIELSLQSENLVKYEIISKNSNNSIKQDTENTNLYYLTICEPSGNFIVNITNNDIIKWNINVPDNKKVKFHLTFTPNYLNILENKLFLNKKLVKRNKNNNRIIKNLQFKINEIKDSKIENQSELSNLKAKNIVLERNLKDNTICLSILKNEEAQKRLTAKKLQDNLNSEKKINKNLNDELTLLKTSIDKYRVENKKLVIELNNKKNELTNQNKKIKDIEKTNTENVRQNYILQFENDDFKKTTTDLQKKISSLNGAIHDCELEISDLKIDIDELTIQRDHMIDEHDSTMNEFEHKLNDIEEKNSFLIKENKQLLKENDYYLKMKEDLELELIDCKLKNTELELKTESLLKKKSNNNIPKDKKGLLKQTCEIFDWYKSALPPKLKISNIMKNLESEILSSIKEI